MTSDPAQHPRLRRRRSRRPLPSAPVQRAAAPVGSLWQQFTRFLQSPAGPWFWIAVVIAILLVIYFLTNRVPGSNQPWHNDWPASRQPKF